MKIRTGFVSNSSSSSFVLIVEKNHFEEMIAKAHPFTQALVAECGAPVQVLGVEAVRFNGYDEHGENWLEGVSVDYHGEPYPTDDEWEGNDNRAAWEEVEKLFGVHWQNKNIDPLKVFYSEQDY
jgi:hypothetical protein